MPLRLYNTLTRRVEPFEPMEQGKVKVYTCGPTIHDYAHIGNFRTFIVSDLVRRYLRFRGFHVYQVMNLTDVEDKIIRKSREAGLDFRHYTQRFADAFFEDLKTLNIEKAEEHPRATDPQVLDKMAEIVERLLDEGYAYRAEDGIYYDVSKFSDYGKLACIQVEELQAGARVSQDEYDKETACDFALWKAWDPEDGDVYWDRYQVLGKGRPGWHLECSAMAMIFLGSHFDLHMGGVDLIFPHHQNEIAQSEAFSKEKFVNYWLHAEHLYVEGQKMSKSLGNFYTLRDLLDASGNASGKAWDPMAIRYTLLKVPYGSRLNFTFAELAGAASSLERIHGFLVRCGEQKGEQEPGPILALIDKARQGFVEAMDDNLNIAVALSHLFDLLGEVNPMLETGIGEKAGAALRDFVLELDQVLGLRLGESLAEPALAPEESEMIEARTKARHERNWAEADRLRDELLARGIVLEDTPGGVRWKKSR